MSMNMPGAPMMDGVSPGTPQAFSRGQGQGGGGGNGGGGGGGGGGGRRGNRYVAREEGIVPNPQMAMQMFKNEVAAEIGLIAYDQMDKGWLASRQNGYVGGNMTKKMVAYAESVISQNPQSVVTTTARVLQIQPEVLQANQMASQNFQRYVQSLGAGMTTGMPMDGMTTAMGMNPGVAQEMAQRSQQQQFPVGGMGAQAAQAQIPLQ